MTITVQQSEDPPWGGPPTVPWSQSCAVLHRALSDSSQTQMDTKSKLTLFFFPEHTQLNIKPTVLSAGLHGATRVFSRTRKGTACIGAVIK